MEYDNIINILIDRFPELKNIYEADYEEDDYEGLPHVIYGNVFIPYIVKTCKNADVAKLNEISLFLEEMAQSEDYGVNNLLGVSVIESLYNDSFIDPEPLKILRKHLKEKTLQELVNMEKWYKNHR